MGEDHHEPFQSLGPVEWDRVSENDLKPFLDALFTEARTIVDSIPPTSSPLARSEPEGRGRAKTESALSSDKRSPLQPSPQAYEHADLLRKEWKEVKVNAKENPLDVQVYKLSAKDGKGAWFARRSIHEGLSFDKWKDGLQREFAETMKVQGSPGSGNIRGIGADQRVENHAIQDSGHIQVFQLSAQFPGPTAPRDFITLLCTSDFSHLAEEHPNSPRQFMIVSKPCEHPDCPPRSGIIRGRYESVEIIRELRKPSPTFHRSHSARDVSSPAAETSEREPSGAERGRGGADTPAIEWLMVTRSDPGGSVPRFMIERGTPPGIVNDAGKFLKWVSALSQPTEAAGDDVEESEAPKVSLEKPQQEENGSAVNVSADTGPAGAELANTQQSTDDQPAAADGAIISTITGALGAAGSAISSGIQRQFNSSEDQQNQDSLVETKAEQRGPESDTTPSEASSIRSFASAMEKSMTDEKNPDGVDVTGSDVTRANTPQDKEWRKLEERRRKMDEKTAKLQERMQNKKQGDQEKDAIALAKMKEKHEKEIAKHEAKYHREIKKIEEKREAESRKAEERRRKAAEREDKTNGQLELQRITTERDVALQHVKLLEGQVRELQAQNTKLVANLGKVGSIPGSESDVSSKETKT